MRGRLVEDRIEERICKIRVIDGVIANYYPQEELIRCKDCKHYDIQVQQCTCEADWFGIEPNGFCSRAERKEE